MSFDELRQSVLAFQEIRDTLTDLGCNLDGEEGVPGASYVFTAGKIELSDEDPAAYERIAFLLRLNLTPGNNGPPKVELSMEFCGAHRASAAARLRFQSGTWRVVTDSILDANSHYAALLEMMRVRGNRSDAVSEERADNLVREMAEFYLQIVCLLMPSVHLSTGQVFLA